MADVGGEERLAIERERLVGESGDHESDEDERRGDQRPHPSP